MSRFRQPKSLYTKTTALHKTTAFPCGTLWFLCYGFLLPPGLPPFPAGRPPLTAGALPFPGAALFPFLPPVFPAVRPFPSGLPPCLGGRSSRLRLFPPFFPAGLPAVRLPAAAFPVSRNRGLGALSPRRGRIRHSGPKPMRSVRPAFSSASRTR